MQLNFRDPSIAFRIVIIALGALSTILLIAGTAVDEYVNNHREKNTGVLVTMGCQKVEKWGVSVRVGFSGMSTLALIIILMTSVLCLLQLIATVLNVLVLLGKGSKPPLILSSIITALLLVVIIIANFNFRFSNREETWKVMGPAAAAALLEKTVKDVGNSIEKSFNDYGNAIEKSFNDYGSDLYRRKHAAAPSWGTSYSLLAAAFSFAVFNQIFLIAIHKMSKSGVTTFGALASVLKQAVMEFRDPVKIARLLVTIVLGISFILMVQANVLDGMSVLEIVLFALPILACLAIAISFLLSIMQLVKDKVLTKPLLALSIVSAVLLLGDIVVACINWRNSKGHWETTFKNIAASFCLCIVVIALNAAGLVLAKRGGGGGGGFASSSVVPSTTAPSTGSKPSSNQPSSA